MSERNYVSPEMKIRAVEEYLSRTESLNLTAKKYGVSRSTFQKWLLNYEMFGKETVPNGYRRTRSSKQMGSSWKWNWFYTERFISIVTRGAKYRISVVFGM